MRSQSLYKGCDLSRFDRGTRHVAIVLHNGQHHIGQAVVDASRVDQPPRCYFQAGWVLRETHEVAAWCLLGDGEGPDENWPIWKGADVRPRSGDEIVYWDCDRVRKGYSGPYWHTGVFGTANYRYQNASGPFVSGEPWSQVKCWVTRADLIDFLGLTKVPWLLAGENVIKQQYA